jgi:alkanesulfonate monooxygenase SsuD/methylene tetrahydromethanopterin reductase-like flavin-dependent oxidoreductase (luciferase family)
VTGAADDNGLGAEDNGLGVFLTGLPPAMAVDYAQRAERARFRSAWFPEITFSDSFGTATAAALRTERIALGTGVVGVWSRSAVTMALQAATLHQLSGERLALGLGLQARGYVEGWHGAVYERPVAAMRDYVTILRKALAGEPVSHEGEVFSVRNFQLQMEPPRRPPRIYMAANGPMMIRLAGELADGVLGYFHSVPYVTGVVLPNLRLGAQRGGRSLEDIDVCCGFPSLVTEDDSGLDLVKGQVVMFATALGSAPAYADSVTAAGFEAPMREIQERLGQGDMAGAMANVSEEMADALTLSGSAERVRGRIEQYRAAGLTSVMLNPSPPGGYFPLYEGHFPDEVQMPPFDFPGFLGVLDDTLRLLGSANDPGVRPA